MANKRQLSLQAGVPKQELRDRTIGLNDEFASQRYLPSLKVIGFLKLGADVGSPECSRGCVHLVLKIF